MKNLTNTIHLILAVLFIFTNNIVKAQTVDCGYDEEYALLQDSFFSRLQSYNLAYSNHIKSSHGKSKVVVMDQLPIVIHIVHAGDSLGSIANPRDETILEAIQLTNNYFRQKNDQQNTFANPHFGADTEIGFCLATRDVNGNPASGIVRHYIPDNGEPNLNLINSYIWDRSKYINVFVTDDLTNGSCGSYSQNYDYVKINYGCINSSTLAHELGHYFSLDHIFLEVDDCTNTDCSMDGDRVCDTPPKYDTRNTVETGNEKQACVHPDNTCNSDEDDESAQNPYRAVSLGGMGDQPDSYSNLMGYVHECRNNFTQGQAVRMQFNLLVERSELCSDDSHCASIFSPQHDASIEHLKLTAADGCDQDVNIEVLLANRGAQTLQTIDLILSHNGRQIKKITWEGSLVTGAQEVITFENLEVDFENNLYHVQSQNPNGGVDEDLSSDDNFLSYNSFAGHTRLNFLNADATLDCSGAPIKIGIAGIDSTFNLSYLWRRKSGLIANELNNSPLLNVDIADTYYFTIFKDNFSCAWHDTIVVDELLADDNNYQIEFQETALTCSNHTVTLYAAVPENSIVKWFKNGSGDQIVSGFSASIITAGEYRFEVFNKETECHSYSDWISIIDLRENLVIELVVDGVFSCNSDTVIIDASASTYDTSRYEYTWRDLSHIQNSQPYIGAFVPILEPADVRYLSVTSAGKYSLEILDKATNCRRVRIAVVQNEQEVPIILIEGALLSEPESEVRLNARASSTGEEITHHWTTVGGEILEDINTLEPLIKGFGSYTLTALNSKTNCSTTKTMDFYPGHYIESIKSCYSLFSIQEIFTMQLRIRGRSGFDIDGSWIDSIGNTVSSGNSFSPKDPGSYTAIYFNGLDTIRETILIEEADLLRAQAVIDDVMPISCEGDELVLSGENSINGSAVGYIWRDNKNQIISNEVNITVSKLGKYSLEIADLNTGCHSIDTIFVEIDKQIIQADAGIDQVLTCVVKEVRLGENLANDNYRYIWSRITDAGNVPLATTPQYTTSEGGDFLLQVQNVNTGCLTVDSVSVVDLAEIFDVDIEVMKTTENCADSTFIIGVKNLSSYFDYSLLWDLPNGDQTDRLKFTAKEEGDYILNFSSDLSSCTSIDIFNYVQIEKLSLSITVDSLSGMEANLQGGKPPFEYKWSTGETTQGIQNLKEGVSYAVTVTDAEGCSIFGTSIYGDQIVREFAPDLRDALFVYPNPSDGIFVLKHSGISSGKIDLQVYNATGQFVSSISTLIFLQEARIDLSNYAAGIYFLGIDIQGQVFYERVVIL